MSIKYGSLFEPEQTSVLLSVPIGEVGTITMKCIGPSPFNNPGDAAFVCGLIETMTARLVPQKEGV